MKDNIIFKRIIAYGVDFLIIVFITSLISNINFIKKDLNKYIEKSNSYSESYKAYLKEDIDEEDFIQIASKDYYDMNRYRITYDIALILVVFLYFIVFQKYNHGQTIGKKIMKIKVVNVNEKEASLLSFIIRYIPIQLFGIACILNMLFNFILEFTIKGTNYLIASVILTSIFSFFSIISYIMAFISSDHRGLNDLIANVKVINE